MKHTFFLISKKKICMCSTLFCLSLSLSCTTTLPFCKTKTSNFLVTHYFYGGIVVCAYQRVCFLCSYSLLFFHCHSFSPSWPLSFLIFSLLNFHIFLPTKFVSFVFSHSLQPFLCYPHECKQKIPLKKMQIFCCCFFSLS